MKKYYFYILILCFIISCNYKQKEVKKEKINKEIQIVELSKNVNDSIVDLDFPNNSFKFNIDSTGYMLNSIRVYSNSKCIQIIDAKKELLSKQFELIDWNFDGFKDISVVYNCGSGGCTYWIWNYDPKRGKYFYNKDLSEVLGLEMDSEQKLILFHYRGGDQEEYWDYYEYKNNELVYIKEISN